MKIKRHVFESNFYLRYSKINMSGVVDKFRNLALAIRQNGGLWRSIQTLYRIDEVKDGELVGVDCNGNKYYQNKRFFIGMIK